MDSKSANWPDKIYEAFSNHNIRIIANVPDAGHSELIRLCQADTQMQVVTLTTEEEGVGLLCGAWSGGTKGVLLMQSSGGGNCVNALALPIICRIPFLTIVSMRGEWGEGKVVSGQCLVFLCSRNTALYDFLDIFILIQCSVRTSEW